MDIETLQTTHSQAAAKMSDVGIANYTNQGDPNGGDSATENLNVFYNVSSIPSCAFM